MASEIVGLHIGPSEAEPFWTSFLCDLMRRGLTGVKLVVSDAHAADAGDHADRLAKIHLCMAGRMRQRHEGLAPSGKGTRLANGRLFTPVAPPSRRRSIS